MTEQPQPGETRPVLLPAQVPAVLTGLMLGLFLEAFDGTAISTVMPVIIGDLHGMEFYVWPFAVFVLCSTLAIVIFGRLSDLFGRRAVFLTGIAIFLAGSALSGVTTGMIPLIFFRGIQGLGGGILWTMAFIIVAELFPVRERGRYIGFLVSVFAIASIAGPLLGGLITDTLGWRWVFFINIPLGILAAYLVSLRLPETARIPEHRQIDYAGITAFILCMVPLFLAVSLGGSVLPWSSPQVAGLFIIAATMLFVFVRTQQQAKNPLLPLGLFRNRIYTLTAAAAFFANGLMFAAIIYLPLFLQDVQHASAGESGMVITPMVLSLVGAVILTGRMVGAWGRYRTLTLIGFGILGIGMASLSFIVPQTPLLIVILASVVIGFGTGMLHPLLIIAAQNAFSPGELGVVTSSQQFFRSMGSTLLTPVFGFVMYAGLAGSSSGGNAGLALLPPGNLAHAIGTVFLFCAGIAVICFILVLCLEELPLRSRTERETANEAAPGNPE